MCGQGWESYRTRKLRKKKVLVSFPHWSPFCLKLLQYFHLVLLIKCLQKGFFWYWTWVSFMLLCWITKFFRANPLATWFTACTTPGHEANSPGRLVGCVSGCPSCTQYWWQALGSQHQARAAVNRWWACGVIGSALHFSLGAAALSHWEGKLRIGDSYSSNSHIPELYDVLQRWEMLTDTSSIVWILIIGNAVGRSWLASSLSLSSFLIHPHSRPRQPPVSGSKLGGWKSSRKLIPGLWRTVWCDSYRGLLIKL